MPTPKTTARAGAFPRPSLQKALLWFVASYGLAIIGYLALNALASRFLGRSSFGYFIIIMTATTVVGQFALLGVHRSGLREAARLESDAHDELARLRLGVRAITLVSLPVAGALGAAVTGLTLSGLEPEKRLVLSLEVMALIVLSGHQKLWANYLRGFGRVRFASLLEGRSGGAFSRCYAKRPPDGGVVTLAAGRVRGSARRGGSRLCRSRLCRLQHCGASLACCKGNSQPLA